MATKFFHVCAGCFLIVASFALGTVASQAQSPPVQFDAGRISAALIGRNIVARHTDFRQSDAPAVQIAQPVPGTEPIVSIRFEEWGTGFVAWAVLEGGDVYQIADGGDWHYHGNIFGGGADRRQSSWNGVTPK